MLNVREQLKTTTTMTTANHELRRNTFLFIYMYIVCIYLLENDSKLQQQNGL